MAVLINGKSLCSRCFSLCSNGSECACGYEENERHLLPSGTVLSGKYVVGSCVRSNGVVAEYIGYDVDADCRVRIKEFFPASLVLRSESGSLELTDMMQANAFNQSMQLFMQNIQFVSMLGNGVPVVHVRQAFYENNTAYLIASETAGFTVREYIGCGVRLNQQQLLYVLRDMLFAVNCVHEKHRIHGNLTADTVYITNSGAVLDGFEPTEEALAVAVRDPRHTLNGADWLPSAQFDGESGKPAADIAAIGMIAYALLTGDIPESSFRDVPQIGADALVAQVSDVELLRILRNMCRVGVTTYTGVPQVARELAPVFQQFGLQPLVLRETQVHTAELPVQMPQQQIGSPDKKRNTVIAAAGALAIVLIIALAVGLYFLLRTDADPAESPARTTVTQETAEPETEEKTEKKTEKETEKETETESESETEKAAAETTTKETTTKKEEPATTENKQTTAQSEELKTTHKLTPGEKRSLRDRATQNAAS